MTSLIAWLAADMKKEGPQISGITMASDSRISFPDRPPEDDCTKLYASAHRPEILGYVGEVDLAQPVASSFITESLIPGSEFDPHARLVRLTTLLEARRAELNWTCLDTTLLYAARTGVGMKKSTFHLFSLSWTESDGKVQATYFPVEHTKPSMVVELSGTGRASVKYWQEKWSKATPDLHYTRHFFSAFCDSIWSGRDTFSGGVPQVAVVRRTKNGQPIGFVNETGTYLKGRLLAPPYPSDLEFVNENYQFVDSQGNPTGKRRFRPHEAPRRK
ncbi:hypothetical protein [Burkholderia diffusa]|uniref:Uncharacterized protein n=1 Tax=Burkholderia diffusa TaxID=488732 RepID=A0A6P2R0G5_9BURK|nr:hypothetical protein [Burkholderia diffusa]KAB0650299.1 hypothetical protein F7R23_24700 [Burkholderia diffusa]MBM2657008.1 hypothetical protein [Burkholderia diffusa]VWC28917.1 hypothetical protein BDI24065_06271 [Burkholderia diffusa]